MTAYQFDREFADEHEPELRQILERNLIRLVSLRPATENEDRRQATDYVVETSIGELAFRVRRDRCNFRDITLRYRRRTHRGAKWTGGYEVDKLLGGYCRAYLYAWERR